MPRPLAGLVAGLAATVPMTVAMELMFRGLPRRERYPLPPRWITDRLISVAGLEGEMDESRRREAALLSHFAYGAAAGAAYAPIAERVRIGPLSAGVLYGLGVWTVSYLGWLPAAGILGPATRHPARRNALMIAAHVVWGAATGYIAHHLDEDRGESGFARRSDRPAAMPAGRGV